MGQGQRKGEGGIRGKRKERNADFRRFTYLLGRAQLPLYRKEGKEKSCYPISFLSSSSAGWWPTDRCPPPGEKKKKGREKEKKKKGGTVTPALCVCHCVRQGPGCSAVPAARRGGGGWRGGRGERGGEEKRCRRLRFCNFRFFGGRGVEARCGREKKKRKKNQRVTSSNITSPFLRTIEGEGRGKEGVKGGEKGTSILNLKTKFFLTILYHPSKIIWRDMGGGRKAVLQLLSCWSALGGLHSVVRQERRKERKGGKRKGKKKKMGRRWLRF